MRLPANSKFEELKAAGALPSPKGVALALMRATRNEEVKQGEIVRIVKADPALSGRLIRAANSAAYACRPVASIPDAVMVLGIRAVRQLALGFSLVSNYDGGACTRFDYPAFWSRSLLMAIATPLFARHTRAAAGEELFVCGLLSRIGALALATAFPGEYAEVLARCETDAKLKLVTLEQEAFGIGHDELTAALLAEWGMPVQLVEPVRHHEEDNCPHGDGARGALLRNLLHLSAFFADMCLGPEGARRRLLPQLFLLASRVGLAAEGVVALGDQAVREWREWATLLHVESRDVASYADLALAIPDAPETEANEGRAAEADRLRVLIVDDDHSVIVLLKKLLGANYTVHLARDGAEALEVALKVEPHIVITDWLMPKMDGIALCKALRATALGSETYILILTALEDEERLVEAFAAGADDYVAKPLRPRVLAARLSAGSRVIRLRRKIESDRDDIRRFATELACANRRLHQTALVDVLTGVPNRRYGIERLHQEWSAAQRDRQALACLIIDVDHFKQINDGHGHDAGDTVLKHVAQIMKQAARVQDVLARMGGEEFMLVLPRTGRAAAVQCAERLRALVAAARIAVGGAEIGVTVSIGVATATPQHADAAAILKAADIALYAAKQAGRNRVCASEAPSGAAPTLGAGERRPQGMLC